jgi:prophage antirepressor-like protein
MATQVVPFQFENHDVRVVLQDDQPWWVAADVCTALKIANNRDAISRLDDDEKGVALTDTLGGKQEVTIINEPGLYSLILGSRKPEAKRFKRWVTHEVLPAIRKTGSYSLSNPTAAEPSLMALRMAPLAIDAAKAFGFSGNHAFLSADNYIKTITGISVLSNMGQVYFPADPQGRTHTPTALGERLDPPMSARKFNLLLEVSGFQILVGGSWEPTVKAVGLYEWIDVGKLKGGTPIKQLRWFDTILRASDFVSALNALTPCQQAA